MNRFRTSLLDIGIFLRLIHTGTHLQCEPVDVRLHVKCIVISWNLPDLQSVAKQVAPAQTKIFPKSKSALQAANENNSALVWFRVIIQDRRIKNVHRADRFGIALLRLVESKGPPEGPFQGRSFALQAGDEVIHGGAAVQLPNIGKFKLEKMPFQ